MNEKWSIFLLEGYILSESIDIFQNWLRESSEQLPLILFYEFEDNGWSYNLFYSGWGRSTVQVNYYLPKNFDGLVDRLLVLANNQGKQAKTHPGLNRLAKQLINSLDLETHVKSFYATKNVETFKVFGVSDEAIEQLDHILSADWFLEQECEWLQVYEFKKILECTELIWMNYENVKKDNENKL